MTTLPELRKQLDRKLEKYKLAKKSLKKTRIQLKKSRRRVKGTTKALEVVQTIAADLQASAHQQVASIVSKCLETVFDDPYEFEIEFVKKRARTEARLVFKRDGVERDPKTGIGGGVLDMAAFGLRLAALVLTRPRPRKVLILDEPFRFVSASYLPRVRDLLQQLAEELKVQLIVVTHITTLQIGTLVNLGD